MNFDNQNEKNSGKRKRNKLECLEWNVAKHLTMITNKNVAIDVCIINRNGAVP